MSSAFAVDSSRRRRWSTAFAVSGTALKSPQLTALAARCRRSVWWATPIASPLLHLKKQLPARLWCWRPELSTPEVEDSNSPLLMKLKTRTLLSWSWRLELSSPDVEDSNTPLLMLKTRTLLSWWRWRLELSWWGSSYWPSSTLWADSFDCQSYVNKIFTCTGGVSFSYLSPFLFHFILSCLWGSFSIKNETDRGRTRHINNSAINLATNWCFSTSVYACSSGRNLPMDQPIYPKSNIESSDAKPGMANSWRHMMGWAGGEQTQQPSSVCIDREPSNPDSSHVVLWIIEWGVPCGSNRVLAGMLYKDALNIHAKYVFNIFKQGSIYWSVKKHQKLGISVQNLYCPMNWCLRTLEHQTRAAEDLFI